ncbi:hypothetical protein MBLNU459_g8269t1 [Dothideomycetes sp. NU459]
MTIHSPWETSPSKSGPVNISSSSTPRHLFARVMGPPRQHHHHHHNGSSSATPIVLIEAGGGSSSSPWLGLMRVLAASNIRAMAYNRAGLPGSDAAPTPPGQGEPPRSALALAADLEALLRATGVGPPYLVVAHSYAGIQVRTWIEVRCGGGGGGGGGGRYADIAGCVFLDAVAQDTYARMPIRAVQWEFLSRLDYGRVTGLDRSYKLLTPEEYEAWKTEGGGETLAVDEAAERLAGYRQYDRVVLGDRAISVIKGSLVTDLRKLCVEAERVGLGTPEQRRVVTDNLEGLNRAMEESQRGQLRLSRNGRMAYAFDSGHVVFLTEPDVVLGEIKWVLDQYNMKEV